VSKPKLLSRLLPGLLGLLLVASCASRSGNSPFRSAGQGVDVQINVENRDFSDATIYAHWNGFKTRLGMVVGKSGEMFRVPWRSEEIQLEADFVGIGRTWSDVIDVYEGDHLIWLIQPTW